MSAEIINMPAVEYHANREHVSKSWLDKLKQSPAHLRHYLDNDKPETKALRLGRIVHCAVLEPDIFARDFVVMPKFDGRTTAGKAGLAEFEAANVGKLTVSAAELAATNAMRESIMRHPAARALLNLDGAPELSAFWADPVTGQPCKCRPDWLANVVCDVKTTEDASPNGFAKSVAKYRYHVQAAHYLAGLERERFIVIAVEKTPPFAVGVYVLADADVAKGGEARRNELERYADCVATGSWPAYSDKIENLFLPAWA
jgi:hypothetical protein